MNGFGNAYRRHDVPVRGGTLRVGEWGERGPLVVAAHGITSSHLAWSQIGPQLAGECRLVAADLRGRGASRDLPAPYGMASHADDLAAVVARFGGGSTPAVLVGHSMGGFAAVAAARRHPHLVSRLVLVDGGAPLPLPPGVTGDTESVARAVGAAFPRLRRTYASPEEYRRLWRAHPAFADWTDAMAAYVDYDLVREADDRWVPACRPAAVTADAPALHVLPGVRPAPLPAPGVFLRAPRGLLDEPRPLYEPGRAAEWLPGVTETTVPDTNHYSITLGSGGAAAVVGAVREALQAAGAAAAG